MESGKSETAKPFIERGFNLVKFAGPLKDMTRVFLFSLGMENEEIQERVEGMRKMEDIPGLQGVTTRRIMQTIGSDWGRDILYPDLWTDIAIAAVRRQLRTGQSVIVDDLRFPNEMRALECLGAFTVRVIRPDRRLVPSAYEGQLDGEVFCATLYNDGSLSDLHAKADGLARRVLAS